MNLGSRLQAMHLSSCISNFIRFVRKKTGEHAHVVLFKHIDKHKACQFLLDFDRIFLQSHLKTKLGILSFSSYEAHIATAAPPSIVELNSSEDKNTSLCFILICKTPPLGEEKKYYLESPEHQDFINNYIFKKGCILADSIEITPASLQTLSQHNKPAYDIAMKRLALNLQVGDYQGRIVTQLKQLMSDPCQSFQLTLSRSRLPWKINLLPTCESAIGLHQMKNRLHITPQQSQNPVRSKQIPSPMTHKKSRANTQTVQLIAWPNGPYLSYTT